jgi:hypothetical protein
MHRWSTVIEIGMKRRGVEPGERLLSHVQAYEGGKAKGQEHTGNLRMIGLHQLRMRIGDIVVEERNVADVHVRIDQSWYEKSPFAVRTGRQGSIPSYPNMLRPDTHTNLPTSKFHP